MNPDILDCRLKAPCTILLIGKTNSGKSEIILDIIPKRNQIFNQRIEKVFYIYQSYQKRFDEFLTIHPDVIFLSKSTDLPETNGEQVLLVFDDKMLDFQSNAEECKYITDVFIRLSHHNNITCLVTLQSMFAKNLRCLSTNATYHILFPNNRDMGSIDHLNRQVCPSSPYFLRESIKDVAREPYRFLLIDNHASTHDSFRFRNFIYPLKNCNVYIPQNVANCGERRVSAESRQGKSPRKKKIDS